jgi:imidazolonepropionase-like amidohydrolase
MFARTRAEVAAALRLAAARKLRPILVDPRCGAPAILEAAAAAGIAPADLSAVFVLDLDDPLFRLRAPGILARAGAAVGFGSGGPARGPGAARRAAALALRHGMDPGQARHALLGRGFGALRGAPSGAVVGEPADLVLLEDDPEDPASRVLGVLAAGEEVGAAAPGRRFTE